MSPDERAHDLALLYVKYQLYSQMSETDILLEEDDVLDMYKTAFDNFFESLVG